MHILDQILIKKRLEVEELKITLPISKMPSVQSTQNKVSFHSAISDKSRVNIIAEIKKASPSRGVLMESFDPSLLAATYKAGGAAALSVLTERFFFQGLPEYVAIAKKASGLPILWKDFIFDSYQVHYARSMGADAILLIACMLNEAQLAQLLELAESLALDALVEIHSESELTIAVNAGAKVIGVNNRDLTTFEVDIALSERLSKLIPSGVTKVCESGIFSAADILRMKQAGYNAFLVGEALSRSTDPAALLGELRGAA